MQKNYLGMLHCLIEMLITHERNISLTCTWFPAFSTGSEVPTPIGNLSLLLMWCSWLADLIGIGSSNPVSDVPTNTFPAQQQLVFRAQVYIPLPPLSFVVDTTQTQHLLELPKPLPNPSLS